MINQPQVAAEAATLALALLEQAFAYYEAGEGDLPDEPVEYFDYIEAA